MTACGRFAPSPTGLLHLGNVRTALLAWLQARQAGGAFLLRVEDLDPDRSRPELEAGQLDDLRYLGLSWDAPPLHQSERAAIYAQALERLRGQDQLYPCYCSRAEIARAASAPHGDDGPRYPGTCAGLSRLQQAERQRTRSPAWRFRVPPGQVTVHDLLQGPYTQDVAAQVGDFILCRMDGVASYQLAVVVDDAASHVTHVLRGADLLSSTPRQWILHAALGLTPPAYTHVPLLLGEDGARLAKRARGTTVQGHRTAEVPPQQLVGWLAYSAGLGDGQPAAPEQLIGHFRLSALRPAAPLDVWQRLPLEWGRRP